MLFRLIATALFALTFAAPAAAQSAPQSDMHIRCNVGTTEQNQNVILSFLTTDSQDLVEQAAGYCGLLASSDSFKAVSNRWDLAQSGFDAICGVAFNENLFMIASATRDDTSVRSAAGACNFFRRSAQAVKFADRYASFADE